MLTSTLGIRLILWLGKIVPLPAPLRVSEALQSVEVISDPERGDGFQITFNIQQNRLGDSELLRDSALNPFNRVVIGVMLGVATHILIDGVITHHELSPGADGRSLLTVTGSGLSMVLNQKQRMVKYPNHSDAMIVAQILKRYTAYGLVPALTPTPEVPLSAKLTPCQPNKTDKSYIEQLASRNGYVFYIEPVALGVNKAYFGPDIRTSAIQSALSLNMGASTNLLSASFSYDSTLPVEPSGLFTMPGTTTALPIPAASPRRIPLLAKSPTPARRTIILENTADKDLVRATALARQAKLGSLDPVSGEVEIDTIRYGHILRTRRLVGIRGVGRPYDGLYYVGRMTHNIERGKYTQRASVRREGLGALLPVVPL